MGTPNADRIEATRDRVAKALCEVPADEALVALNMVIAGIIVMHAADEARQQNGIQVCHDQLAEMVAACRPKGNA